MDPTDVAWFHMDRPTNLMVVNTVLWFDVPVDQAKVLQVFQERVVSRFRRFRNSLARRREKHLPVTSPVSVSSAANRLVVPWRL